MGDVAVAFDDVDYFEAISRVLKKDQIVFKCDAAEIWSQLWTFLAHREGERGKMVTVCAQAGNEFPRHSAVAAGPDKIVSQIGEITQGRSPEVRPIHSVKP